MELSNLYKGFTPPLGVKVVETKFSHPKNFVKRMSKTGEETNIDDPEGCWMNAGIGGGSNTIDLELELQDSQGLRVGKCDIVPLCVTLWCTDNGVVVGKMKDEVLSSTEKDRSGHRHGANGLLTVSGKQRSNLHIKHDGSGMVSVRIETTSQLNDRRHFTVNITPDVNQMKSQGKASFRLFSTRACQPGDTVLLNPGLSKPIEVMTKINGLNKKREQNPLISAQKFMQRAVTELEKDPSDRSKIDADAVEKLLNMCKHIRSMILKKLPKDFIPPQFEKVVSSDILQELKKPLDPSTKDIGMIDLRRSDSNFFEEMVENYARGSAQVVDCLYANDGMYVTLDSQGEGNMARGVRPFSRQNSLSMPDGTLLGTSSIGTGMNAGDIFQDGGQVSTSRGGVDAVVDALNYGQQAQPQQIAGDADSMKIPAEQPQSSSSPHHYQILRIPYMSTLADNLATRTGIKDNSSQGNLGEFVQNLQQRESELEALFRRIDEDGDGKITLEELLKARDDEILQGSDEEIQELHDFMDSQRQKDGYIDFDEFVSAVTLLPNSTALKDIARVYGQRGGVKYEPLTKKRRLVA